MIKKNNYIKKSFNILIIIGNLVVIWKSIKIKNKMKLIFLIKKIYADGIYQGKVKYQIFKKIIEKIIFSFVS